MERRSLIVLLIAFAAWCGWGEGAWAQAQRKWLNVGDIHHKLSATGTEPEVMRQEGLIYPAISPNRQPKSHYNRKHLWIGVASHTNEDGETFAPRVVHTGPRDYHLEQFFPKPMLLVSRFEAPEAMVDGFPTFDKPVTVDEVDPGLNAARMVIREANTLLGVTMYNEVRAFSQAYHNSYLVYDYTFTNTGNTDADDEIELPDQTLEGLVISISTKYQYQTNIGARGTNTMSDVVGDGMENYDVPFRSQYSWHGAVPWTEAEPGGSLGCPAWTDQHFRIAEGDSLGRLTCTEFVTRTTIHADERAYEAGTPIAQRQDDLGQPSQFGFIRGGDPITNNNDAYDQLHMTDEYAYIHPELEYADYGAGTQYPHHADLVAPKGNFDSWAAKMAAQVEMPSLGHDGGWVPTISYGPYTLGPGESIRIVYVEGFAGLSEEANVAIGRAYKLAGGDLDALIEYDADGDGVIEDAAGNGLIEGDEVMTKNRWVMTGRDSLWQMLYRAEANFESGYAIPHAPKPPRQFEVTSGTDRIALTWETFDGEEPPGGFEIYRARNRYQGAVEDGFQYERIAALGPGERRYEDTEVVRGISYFYYIQSVGEVNQDPTGLTPTGVRLRSSRHYTQTYNPAFLQREPGAGLEAARVVPNPYNLASDKNVRWPDQQDKIAFLEIPGECTIKIYTETGELIETIKHDNGSGDAYWNLTTSSNQLVVSGVYFAVIIDDTTGEKVFRNFVIIR